MIIDFPNFAHIEYYLYVKNYILTYLFKEAFDMAYEVGSSLSLKNLLNLTPLTLSAKLARVEMFYHILKLEREIYWQIGKNAFFMKSTSLLTLLMVSRKYNLCSISIISNRYHRYRNGPY